jgi:hypothetical protein
MQVFDRSWTAKASRNLLKNDHLTARLGRINQFHLGCPIDQDGALIDVCLIRDLASRQRGRLFKEREGADTLAASDTGIVKPEALLEKRDHVRVMIKVAIGIGGVLFRYDRIQPAQHCA